jgi:hypothetical protein
MRRVTSYLGCRFSTTVSKFYIPILLVLLLIAASSISVFFSSTHAQEQPTETNSVQPVPTPKKGCCGDTDKDKPHYLAASYYNVGNNLTATLMLNNKGPAPVEVKPTLFSLSGESLEAAPVIVPGESFRNIDLRDLGATPGTSFQEGSLQLFHLGPDLVIGAQLYLVDEQHSLSFDEKLVEFQNTRSAQLESVWWLPSRNANVKLLLSNTSGLELTANVVINAGTPHPETVDVTLSPHETRVIQVEREKPGNGPVLRDDVGSASIHHSGEKGSLVARALIANKKTGYSFSAQFYSPQGGKSSGYQGVGLRLATATGEGLTPVMVARNVGDETTYLTGRVPYTKTDGSTGVVQLPKVKLEAGEAASVDVARTIRTKVKSQQIAAASLEFDYTTAPGSVIMTAQSVSDSGNQVFRVPMWDVPAQRNGTGGYPWFIDGSSSTYVYIKNVTDTDQNYTFSLTYEGGDYSTGVKSVKAGQTVVYDLRAMRDNQVKDERGRTIPPEANRGKITWSVRGPKPLALLGRSEQVDLAKGTSSSYSCFMCCPNTYGWSYLDPGEFFMKVSDTRFLRGVQVDYNCYGIEMPPYYWGETWSINNVNVAAVSGSGTSADMTAVGNGGTDVVGQWTVYRTTFRHDINNEPYCDTFGEVVEHPAPVEVVGVDRLQYQSGSNYVDITGTLYVLKGTSVTFKALPSPSDKQFQSGLPVWSGTSGATGSGPTISVTFNTISSSTSDFKTVTATSGNGMTANVIVYELTGVFTPQDNFAGRSLTRFGLLENVNLSFTANPSVTASEVGGLGWIIVTGPGTLPATSNGETTYTAPAAEASTTLKLKINSGPSKDSGPTYNIVTVAPSGAYMIKKPGTGLRHQFGKLGVGFFGNAYLTPKDVSFSRLHFSEGVASASASGYWASLNGAIHPANGPFTISGCNIITGCLAFEDLVDTNDWDPPFGNGNFTWVIPWRYVVGSIAPSYVRFTDATHYQTAEATGRATIQKAGAGPFEKDDSDPTSFP